MISMTSLRATTIPSHGLHTLSRSLEVNGSPEANGSLEENRGWKQNGAPQGKWWSRKELQAQLN